MTIIIQNIWQVNHVQAYSIDSSNITAC